VLFYHSLVSDWNHGNAHFLRGVATELLARGHDVQIYEPQNGWSLQNLLAEHGEAALSRFKAAYPALESTFYHPERLDLDEALDGADLVLVHEWNSHSLVRAIGRHRSQLGGYRLLFHDTHHRTVTDPKAMAAYDLTHYDGVLAYGRVIRDLYLSQGRAAAAWTWHEAADTRIFRPYGSAGPKRDLVWIGNWGDEERTAELDTFLLKPVRALGLKTLVHGVRYPDPARAALAEAKIEYGGWLPNYDVPKIFSQSRVTVHIPRRPYAKALPGIPTIRPFEALACGIPMISTPWEDVEGLFTPGTDFLIARNGTEMKRHLRALLHDEALSRALALHGRRTVLERHTCGHRVDQLLEIDESLRSDSSKKIRSIQQKKKEVIV
jgi:spore maturation protein CgeB